MNIVRLNKQQQHYPQRKAATEDKILIVDYGPYDTRQNSKNRWSINSRNNAHILL